MRYPFFLLLVIAVLLPGNGSAASGSSSVANSLIQGQELIFARRYSEALDRFRRLEEEHPASPAGYFGQMAVYEVMMLEEEDFSKQPEFEEAVGRGRKAIEITLQKYSPTAEELMYAGSLYGLQGFHEARQHHWWNAYTLGSKSRQLFRRILREDPSFVDAEFGIGMYLYWRSIFADRLFFLPIIPDRREEGTQMVRRVAEKGWIARDLAKVNLAVILLQEKYYDEAIASFQTYREAYPKNIIIRMFLGKALLAAKRYNDATTVFREIVAIEPKAVKRIRGLGGGL